MAETTASVQQFLHTAINVTHLARAAQFYGEILEIPQATRNLNFPGLWYQVGGCQIHLIQAESVHPATPDTRWGRNPHLALGVTDLEAVKAKLRQAGVDFQASHSGRAAIFVKDPDGNIIELSQLQ